MENVKIEKHNGLAWVTIHRPSKMNALNADVLDDLEQAFQDLACDDNVRIIAITGSGEKAFVAGADITQFPKMSPEDAHAFAARGQQVFSLIESSKKPVIAAVNGFALGGGCELALSCHLRIAVEDATFGQPEVKLGVIAGFGGTQRLPRLIGSGRALDLLLTGRLVKASEALSLGLVNTVVPAESLKSTVETLASNLMEQGPQAQGHTLRAVYDGAGKTLKEGLNIEAQAFSDVFNTADRVEGATAFLERRTPKFNNR